MERLYLKFPTLEDKQKVLDFKAEFLRSGQKMHGVGGLSRIDTYEELRLYNEALAYAQYESFNEIYSEFAASQGYIQCGLSLSVVFDLKVVQVD